MSKVKTEQELTGAGIGIHGLKRGDPGYLDAEYGPASPEYMTGENGEAKDIESLDDFLTTFKRKYEKLVIKGRVFHFQGGSPKARDRLLAKHRKDDGSGNVSYEESMWMTDAIALTWVLKENGPRILDTKEKAERFHAEADSDDERAMYAVAKRMLGLKDEKEKETSRKNSGEAGGTVNSPTSPAADTTLYPENS